MAPKTHPAKPPSPPVPSPQPKPLPLAPLSSPPMQRSMTTPSPTQMQLKHNAPPLLTNPISPQKQRRSRTSSASKSPLTLSDIPEVLGVTGRSSSSGSSTVHPSAAVPVSAAALLHDHFRVEGNAFYQEELRRRRITPPVDMHPAMRNDEVPAGLRQLMAADKVIAAASAEMQTASAPGIPSTPAEVKTVEHVLGSPGAERKENVFSTRSSTHEGGGFSPSRSISLSAETSYQTQQNQASQLDLSASLPIGLKTPKKGLLEKLRLTGSKTPVSGTTARNTGTADLNCGIGSGSGGGSDVPVKARAVLGTGATSTTPSPSKKSRVSLPSTRSAANVARSPSKKKGLFTRKLSSGADDVASTERKLSIGYPMPLVSNTAAPLYKAEDKRDSTSGHFRKMEVIGKPPTPPAKNTPPRKQLQQVGEKLKLEPQPVHPLRTTSHSKTHRFSPLSPPLHDFLQTTPTPIPNYPSAEHKDIRIIHPSSTPTSKHKSIHPTLSRAGSLNTHHQASPTLRRHESGLFHRSPNPNDSAAPSPPWGWGSWQSPSSLYSSTWDSPQLDRGAPSSPAKAESPTYAGLGEDLPLRRWSSAASPRIGGGNGLDLEGGEQEEVIKIVYPDLRTDPVYRKHFKPADGVKQDPTPTKGQRRSLGSVGPVKREDNSITFAFQRAQNDSPKAKDNSLDAVSVYSHPSATVSPLQILPATVYSPPVAAWASSSKARKNEKIEVHNNDRGRAKDASPTQHLRQQSNLSRSNSSSHDIFASAPHFPQPQPRTKSGRSSGSGSESSLSTITQQSIAPPPTPNTAATESSSHLETVVVTATQAAPTAQLDEITTILRALHARNGDISAFCDEMRANNLRLDGRLAAMEGLRVTKKGSSPAKNDVEGDSRGRMDERASTEHANPLSEPSASAPVHPGTTVLADRREQDTDIEETRVRLRVPTHFAREFYTSSPPASTPALSPLPSAIASSNITTANPTTSASISESSTAGPATPTDVPTASNTCVEGHDEGLTSTEAKTENKTETLEELRAMNAQLLHLMGGFAEKIRVLEEKVQEGK